MKLIIAGSRSLNINNSILFELLSFYNLRLWAELNTSEIVSGGCPTGPDSQAKRFSKEYNIMYKEFPANWEEYGKSAGPIRNKQMAEYSDALLLIWDGESKGSKNMKKEMKALNKPIFEVILKHE